MSQIIAGSPLVCVLIINLFILRFPFSIVFLETFAAAGHEPEQYGMNVVPDGVAVPV